MKVRSSIKKLCSFCKLIKRFSRIYIKCIRKRHKQIQR